jgi:hypothetical protein
MKRNETIQVLPTELFRIIFSYFVQSWQDAIRFGLICKEWKIIADHSFIWLKSPLEFYAPQSYYDVRYISKSRFSEMPAVSLREAGDKYPDIQSLKCNQERIYAANKYKIQFFISSNNLGDIEINDTSNSFQILAGNSTENIRDKGESRYFSSDNSTENATKVRAEFMKIFVRYHYLWDRQTKRIRLFAFLGNKLENMWKGPDIIYTFLILFVLEGVAIYLFSNISRNNFSLSIANHFGFICFYLILFVLMTIPLIRLTNCMLIGFQIPPQGNLELPISETVKGNLTLLGSVFYLIGMILTFVFLQITLSTSDFPYFLISIPLWCCALIKLILCFLQIIPTGTVTMDDIIFLPPILSAFPLMVTLVTIFFTNKHDLSPPTSMSSGLLLWCTTLPIFPFEAMPLCFALYRTIQTFRLLRGDLLLLNSPHPYCSCLTGVRVKLLARGCSLTIVWLMVSVLVYLNVKIVEFSIELSVVLIAIILLIALGQLLWFPQQFDTDFFWS